MYKKLAGSACRRPPRICFQMPIFCAEVVGHSCVTRYLHDFVVRASRLLTPDRKPVEKIAVLRVDSRCSKARVSGQRFGPCCPCCGADPRRRVVRSLGLGRKDSLRSHVGGRGRCCRQRLCAVRTPGFGQAGTLACDDRRGAIFERCVRNEKQADKNKTNNSQERESWHCRAPTIHSTAPYPIAKPRLHNKSSWTMGLSMRVRPLTDGSTQGPATISTV